MEDSDIVELYWQRSETALILTREKYGPYCYSIAYGILCDHQDAEEAENDTYLAAWNSMPPHKPELLRTFLGKLTRRISLDMRKMKHTQMRGGGELPLSLNELAECIPDRKNVGDQLETAELAKCIDAFLRTLPQTERKVFLCRYWYLDPIAAISTRFGFSQSKVKMMLLRTRRKLHRCLEKEGYFV